VVIVDPMGGYFLHAFVGNMGFLCPPGPTRDNRPGNKMITMGPDILGQLHFARGFTRTVVIGRLTYQAFF
jgi:hypothetical protein